MLVESIIDAFTSIWLNRKRIVLVVLGIAISVWMIIIIFSLKTAIEDAVYTFLSNEYAVTQSVTCKIISQKGDNEKYGLSKDELEELEKDLPASCKKVVIKSTADLQGRILNPSNQRVILNGVSTSYFECMKMELIEGRFLDERDYAGEYSGVVISDVAAKSCFESVEDAIGSKLIFFSDDGLSLELYVIGVYHDKIMDLGYGELNKYSSTIYCTNNYLEEVMNITDSKYTTFYVLLNDLDEIEHIAEYMENELKNRVLDDDYYVQVYGMDLFDDMYKIVNIIVVMFMLVIIIAFLVSGISIMNVMLISVRRRTREIGIQKALGEKNIWIKLQFIVEACIISIIGEIIGLSLGMLSVFFISSNWQNILSKLVAGEMCILLSENVSFMPAKWSILISTLYCLCTSILFGFLPANKASKLEIVEALRFKN